MSRRVVGAAFCAISASLFATYHLSKALRSIAASVGEGWVGSPSDMLLIGSVLAVAIGIFYLMWGELTAGK